MKFLFVLAALAAHPNPTSQDSADGVQAALKLNREGKYMAALDSLEKLAKTSSDPDNLAAQALGWYFSFVGEYDAAMNASDKRRPAGPATVPASIEEIDGAKAEDAISAIVRQSKGRQIVILNEAHHVPRSRAFGLLLARALWKEGFEFFAAETFTKDVDAAFAQKTASRAMGFYTNEPFFGDFVRQTMRLGFKPVYYEAERHDAEGDVYARINGREIQQSENLNERWFKQHPKSRIFIYCGYSHAMEGWVKEEGNELAWMAARLSKLTGIDPLTIDQSEQIPHPNTAYETKEYRYADGKGLLRKGPKVFAQPNGKYVVCGPDWKARVDMQVFAGNDVIESGRPSWALVGGYRKLVSVPTDKLPEKGRVLVQAFNLSKADEIPVDQVIAIDRKSPALALPKGRYRLVIQDPAGDSKPVGEIRVK